MKCVKNLIFKVLIALAFLPDSSYALLTFRGPHRLEIGPEWYYMSRTRKGGSNQDGNLVGVSILYDRIRKNALYWAFEAYYAEGMLNGRKSGNVLRSNKRDSQIEGRFGYTFRKSWGRNLLITPYAGGGFFQETNRFISPSPVEYKIRNQFPYFDVGFLFRCELTRRFSAGLNFKTMIMIGARSKIFNDPDIEDHSLVIEDKPGFEVEVPLTYRFCDQRRGFQASIVPFYRFRRYGSHENFPFDFIDTRFQIGGLKLMIGYLF